jgi:hypothetical protein
MFVTINPSARLSLPQPVAVFVLVSWQYINALHEGAPLC